MLLRSDWCSLLISAPTYWVEDSRGKNKVTVAFGGVESNKPSGTMYNNREIGSERTPGNHGAFTHGGDLIHQLIARGLIAQAQASGGKNMPLVHDGVLRSHVTPMAGARVEQAPPGSEIRLKNSRLPGAHPVLPRPYPLKSGEDKKDEVIQKQRGHKSKKLLRDHVEQQRDRFRAPIACDSAYIHCNPQLLIRGRTEQENGVSGEERVKKDSPSFVWRGLESNKLLRDEEHREKNYEFPAHTPCYPACIPSIRKHVLSQLNSLTDWIRTRHCGSMAGVSRTNTLIYGRRLTSSRRQPPIWAEHKPVYAGSIVQYSTFDRKSLQDRV
ncbi:hypothetical protein B0H17DRAFT_1142409 [Mycena rosella]|uniref:Uncharacterized protein n=1 Tax=Mycena rosella TaxID=1033263 RepID=A0AAD7G571_MYCRO|nr:hypothetical protein B0H17DRAFT_1142409 [Mycena rosella]